MREIVLMKFGEVVENVVKDVLRFLHLPRKRLSVNGEPVMSACVRVKVSNQEVEAEKLIMKLVVCRNSFPQNAE